MKKKRQLSRERASGDVRHPRRAFLGVFAGCGLGAALFPELATGQSGEQRAIRPESIQCAAALAGTDIALEHQEAMLKPLASQAADFARLHTVPLHNETQPALLFAPLEPASTPPARPASRLSSVRPSVPTNIEDLAFASVREMAELLRTRKVSSLALTQMYLDRLRRYDATLHCVITLTDKRALAQAREADRDIASGRYRGPLHGIPWGAKDLIAVKGYPTTWGAAQFQHQQFESNAAVVERLDRAGAVLVAKLSLGTLAMGGDEWFGGMTRNPWNPSEGSLGSSAGPGSAVAAGCVAFALGSETLDSISAPCTRCGATGLRPTFGRVPRTGCMALVWSMDKIGPVCRTVEDCALVLEAVNGADSLDVSSRTVPFAWDVGMNVSSLRVGFLQADFSGERIGISGIPEAPAVREESEQIDRAALDVIRGLGVQLTPVELPRLPWRAMLAIPKAEAAAAFEEMTRTGRDQLLPWQQKNWPNVFRVARFIPAVEYINANRLRRLGMDAVAGLFRTVDVIVAPTNSTQLIVTNLTGHPAVIVPNGFRSNGSPTSLTFLGDEFQEGKLLALAHSYQRATTWHLQHPAWLNT